MRKCNRCIAVSMLSATSSASFGVALPLTPQESVVTAGKTSSFEVRIDCLGDQASPSLGAYEVGVGHDPTAINVDQSGVTFRSQLSQSVQ